MNKKISTLFTAGLLVAGSLCGSAWAQTEEPENPTPEVTAPANGSILKYLGWDELNAAATALESGSKYLIVYTDESNSTSSAYGFDESTQKLQDVTKANEKVLTKDTDVQKFIWEVTETRTVDTYSYTFTNVASGKKLTIDGEAKVVLADNGGEFYFGEEKAVYSGGESANKALYMYVPKTDEDPEAIYSFTWSQDGLTATVVPEDEGSESEGESNSAAITFYEVPSVGFIDAAELNALYNTSGFTFESKKLDDDQSAEAIGNLFNEKRITAVYVGEDIKVDATAFPSYSASKDEPELNIPTGMYFFTENAPRKLVNGEYVANDDYKAWLNATFVVLSSTETVEATNAGRADGDGFSLVEMKGSDLNFYQGDKNDWKTAGNEVSINNACFTVQKSLTDSYPYALGVENFRYRKQASKADHGQTSVQLHVLKHSDNYYLTTENIEKIADMNEFIFKLAPAGMKKGIELLKTEAKVAAFNIRVLSGDNSEVKSLYGKYLTNAVECDDNSTNSPKFVYVAKAKVLAQPETPAYQWAITSIDDTYDVTFTNRETGEHFTASLFPKTDMGENVYELAIAKAEDVTPIYVDENTYNEQANADAKKSMQGLVVELTPVEIDPYAGFLNVEDKTLVTMAFARDSYETSNKWYAGVEEGETDDTYQLNANDEFSNKLSGAAQWQLVKSKNAATILDRSFVYNRDGRVTVQARGDKAYAYYYQLQYVNDGKEMKKYFPAASTDNDAVAEKATLSSTGVNFIIKQAADGAVYLIKLESTDYQTAVIFDETTASGVNVVYEDKHYNYEEDDNHVYAYPEDDNQDMLLKTYLIEEAPEISYPAEEGYISLISELGNYISINENREGIVVDEAQYSFYLNVTDTNAVVPSFYISKAIEGSKDRAYLFNPIDSVSYYVAEGSYDREYQWAEEKEKALFKAGTLNAGRDTIATDIKGVRVNVAEKADDEGVFGGLENFKVQIVLVEDTDDKYYIRSMADGDTKYLYNLNDKLAWTDNKTEALKFTITEGDPTANETIANEVEGVKVIAGNGTVEIQGAAGKNVVIANILGKVVASTTLTSDNQTINVPAGIVVVTVDGEAVKAVVR